MVIVNTNNNHKARDCQRTTRSSLGKMPGGWEEQRLPYQPFPSQEKNPRKVIHQRRQQDCMNKLALTPSPQEKEKTNSNAEGVQAVLAILFGQCLTEMAFSNAMVVAGRPHFCGPHSSLLLQHFPQQQLQDQQMGHCCKAAKYHRHRHPRSAPKPQLLSKSKTACHAMSGQNRDCLHQAATKTKSGKRSVTQDVQPNNPPQGWFRKNTGHITDLAFSNACLKAGCPHVCGMATAPCSGVW